VVGCLVVGVGYGYWLTESRKTRFRFLVSRALAAMFRRVLYLLVVGFQGSLVIGRWLLVVDCWSLVIGRWLLVAGHWLLVIEKREVEKRFSVSRFSMS
jgi:hypothetical protein